MAARLLLRRISSAVRHGDGALLNALRSELQHELSSNPPRSAQNYKDAKIGSFSVDWDDADTEDLVLRRRFGPGEEIALSAILGPLIFEEDNPLPRHFLMKVCVKKLELEPILLFDCTVLGRDDDDDGDSELVIDDVKYLDALGPSEKPRYKGPGFSSLDPSLQEAFKDYLIERGVNSELTNFILLHLCQKEQNQYVNWLRRLENFLKYSHKSKFRGKKLRWSTIVEDWRRIGVP